MEKIRKGTLIKWDDDKGFGFIQQENGDQVFLHISGLKKGTRRRPAVGDTMYFRTEKDERGRLRALQAVIRDVGYKYVDIKSHKTPTILMLFFWIIALCPFGGALYVWRKGTEPYLLIAYGLMSMTMFYLYYEDKRRAKTETWRISEAALHLWELFGGWPGALIAQHTVHHKNKKFSYQFVFWCIVLLHGIVWSDYLFWNGWSDYLFWNGWIAQKILELGP